MQSGENWHDEAIETVQQDEFGRFSIAEHVANLVARNHTWEASRVYGLIGPWGGGKSSVVNMICEQLASTPPPVDSGRFVVARFTPWATSSTDSLLVEFYSSLASALGGGSKAKKARKALGACLRAAAPVVEIVPTFGTLLSKSTRAAGERLTRAQPWEQAFANFSAELKQLRVRVLVVADDIDRLQHEELVTFLKVVRLLGRFPGVDYLLAYDEVSLYSNLAGEFPDGLTKDRSRRFMEKIVQYPLTLPPLLAHQILGRLDSGLSGIMSGTEMAESMESRIENAQELLVRHLSTPRSIDRYLAQLRFVVSMHAAGESDQVDLLLITFLRMQFPEVYARLPGWRRRLTGRRSFSNFSRFDRNEEVDFSSLIDCVGVEEKADVLSLLKELFPVVGGGVGRGAPHISDHLYFDRYFVHMVPEDDIADSTISAALEEASALPSGGRLLVELLTNETIVGLPDLALDKLREASLAQPLNGRGERDVLNLIGNVMSCVGELENGTNTLFRRQERAFMWVGSLIRLLPETTAPGDLLEALSRCPDIELQGRVVWDASKGVWNLEDDGEGRPAYLAQVARLLAERMLDYCLVHLGSRDAADESTSLLFPLMYALKEGDRPNSIARLRDGLGRDYVTEDLAARCVTLAYLVARNPIGRLEGFYSEVFDMIVPADDRFYSESREDVVREDLSWENRRRFARGRAGVRETDPDLSEAG